MTLPRETSSGRLANLLLAPPSLDRHHIGHHMHAIIFDFDGLIIDTESAIYTAWQELYRRHGHDLPQAVYVQCVGSTFGHYDPMAALESHIGRAVDWAAELPVKDARIRELQSDLDTLPGIRELLTEANRAGLPCAIASSSQRSHIDSWLQRTGIGRHFQAILTRDDVPRAKPFPDLFLAAAKALDIVPASAIVLEDSHNGLRAALAAGTPCVIVPSPVTMGSDFTGATGQLSTLAGVDLAALASLHARQGA